MLKEMIASITLVVCGVTARAADPPVARFSPANIDQTANACEDFYQYACGGWLASNPRPPDESWWGPEKMLQVHNVALVRHLAERASKPGRARSKNEQLIRDYYAACMDESQSRRAIAPALARIDALRGKKEIARELATLHRSVYLPLQDGIFPSVADPGSREPLFGFAPLVDSHDPKRVIAFIDQGGLVMGDREYYLATDAATQAVRKSYLEYADKLLSLAAGTNVSADQPRRILALETSLARAWIEPAKRLDFNNLYHALTLRQLESLTPSFAWPEYLQAIGAPPSHRYVVAHPQYLQQVESLLASASLDDWKLYLRWQLLNAAAPMLDEPFARASFEFKDQVLRGLEQREPRSATCVHDLGRDVGDALAVELVKSTLHASDLQRAETIAASVRAALRQQVAANTWLSEPTRREALAKVDRARVRFGYAEKLRDYSSLRISRTGRANNAFLASDYELSRLLKRIGGPPDTNDWWVPAWSVVGYNNPRQLTVSMPAGTLQPPFFDTNADDVINYGALGSFLGHELSHNFDTVGRHYDHRGVLIDWWTPKDAAAFNERASCTATQYSSYEVIDGLRINGQLTSSEDIADAEGLRVALMALNAANQHAGWQYAVSERNASMRNFFLSYATTWCTHVTPALLRSTVSGDRHSPDKFRVNGVVANMPEFQAAFACHKGQAMVHEPRCRVW
jgi:endothelin-converting enzyme/putative endopeptidase